MLSALAEGDLAKVGREAKNVFESVLSLPVIETIKTAMTEHGAFGACMSGSGSAVFGLFDSKEKAQACAAALRCGYNDVYLTHPVERGVLVR